jgi:hypothetical protein
MNRVKNKTRVSRITTITMKWYFLTEIYTKVLRKVSAVGAATLRVMQYGMKKNPDFVVILSPVGMNVLEKK